MPATIKVICPECNKEINAPSEIAGKKVRCKVCGNVFRAEPAGVPGSAGIKAAASPKAAATTPVAPISTDDEDEDSNPYVVSSDVETAARCPECANLMESSDAVICLT